MKLSTIIMALVLAGCASTSGRQPTDLCGGMHYESKEYAVCLLIELVRSKS